jgi:hypothetical protein
MMRLREWQKEILIGVVIAALLAPALIWAEQAQKNGVFCLAGPCARSE